ncbi:MAG: nucleotide pyrophosphohydrolase [Candidatus Uhrbacteria bacterium]
MDEELTGEYHVFMSEIHELAERIKDFRNARDWKQFHRPKDLALSLVLEATEVLELFQWKSETEALEVVDKKKEDLADELADVFYWVLLMGEDFGIDIKDALIKKLEKNEAKYPVEKAKGTSKKYTEL